ncbi:MAG: hypothetical protein QOG76_2135 [Pseudonocardiales bacterium]|nr:hypothetical protein [Pseudonocardiales bacterium]
MVTGLLSALAAMVLNSIAGLLQSDATWRVSKHRPLITQPRYLGGLLVDGLGWVCTVAALRHLPVFAVQAILGGAIALTAITARMLHRSTLRTRDRFAIGACLIGLVLVAASAGNDAPPTVPLAADLVLIVAAGLLVVALVALWPGARAWPLAVIAGLGFGGTSLAVRAIHTGGPDLLVQLLTQPPTYLVLAFWGIGIVSYSRALGMANLARVTAVFVVIEVIVPGLVAMVLLGDTVRAGWWPSMVSGLLLAVLGVMVLADSPAQQPPHATRVR